MPIPELYVDNRGCFRLAEHINENHPGGFRSDDWLSFGNLDAVQYGSAVGERQTISTESADQDDEATENSAH